MVAVVVKTPLYLYDIASIVSDDWLRPPLRARLVVVYADAGVVAARSAPAHFGSVKIRPSGDWLENRALRASVYSSLCLN